MARLPKYDAEFFSTMSVADFLKSYNRAVKQVEHDEQRLTRAMRTGRVMTMSPLELRILLHYRYSPYDWGGPGLSEATEFERDKIRSFTETEHPLLELDKSIGSERTYRLTPRGEVYLDRILATPLPIPVLTWQFPDVLS